MSLGRRDHLRTERIRDCPVGALDPVCHPNLRRLLRPDCQILTTS
ncbi:hypothetical protein PT974_04304 [Cladobotryum mycophilum]|uniref:Uncharacterized protein n=1 Tax=Cladobotryum mycophilum TaxID=491253 RepID=A0ABR0SVV7_9HYPO